MLERSPQHFHMGTAKMKYTETKEDNQKRVKIEKVNLARNK